MVNPYKSPAEITDGGSRSQTRHGDIMKQLTYWVFAGISGGLVAVPPFIAVLIGSQKFTAFAFRDDMGFNSLGGLAIALAYGIVGSITAACRLSVRGWALFMAIMVPITIPLMGTLPGSVAGGQDLFSSLTIVMATAWVASLSAAIVSGVTIRRRFKN